MKKILLAVLFLVGLFVAGCGFDDSVKTPQMDCPDMGKPYTIERLQWSQCEAQYR